VATDSASQAAYFTRTLTKSLPLLTDTEALYLAQWLIGLYALPVFRFISMTLDGYMADALWPYVLGLVISNRITVTQRPPPIGATISQDCYIESIAFDVTADHFLVVFGLSSAAALAGSSFWILEHSVYGVLNSTTKLAY